MLNTVDKALYHNQYKVKYADYYRAVETDTKQSQTILFEESIFYKIQTVLKT